MDCLVLVDMQVDNEGVEGFDQTVEVCNQLMKIFKEREGNVVSFAYDETETSENLFAKGLLPQTTVFIRDFVNSSLESNRFVNYIKNIYGEDINVYICGYSAEDSVYRLASQLITKNINCYIVNDGVLFEEENTGEESISMLVDQGAFLIDSEVISDMI